MCSRRRSPAAASPAPSAPSRWRSAACGASSSSPRRPRATRRAPRPRRAGARRGPLRRRAPPRRGRGDPRRAGSTAAASRRCPALRLAGPPPAGWTCARKAVPRERADAHASLPGLVAHIAPRAAAGPPWASGSTASCPRSSPASSRRPRGRRSAPSPATPSGGCSSLATRDSSGGAHGLPDGESIAVAYRGAALAVLHRTPTRHGHAEVPKRWHRLSGPPHPDRGDPARVVGRHRRDPRARARRGRPMTRRRPDAAAPRAPRTTSTRARSRHGRLPWSAAARHAPAPRDPSRSCAEGAFVGQPSPRSCPAGRDAPSPRSSNSPARASYTAAGDGGPRRRDEQLLRTWPSPPIGRCSTRCPRGHGRRSASAPACSGWRRACGTWSRSRGRRRLGLSRAATVALGERSGVPLRHAPRAGGRRRDRGPVEAPARRAEGRYVGPRHGAHRGAGGRAHARR